MKRILSAILALVMMAGLFAFSVNATEKTGVRFEVDELYRTNKVLSAHPHTFEA